MIVTRVLVFVRTISYSLLLPFLSSSAYGIGTMIIPFYYGQKRIYLDTVIAKIFQDLKISFSKFFDKI
jgi:hypothetical protein